MCGGGEAVAGRGDGLGGAGQGASDDGVVLGGDQEHADGGLVLVGDAQPVVDDGDAEAELPGVSGGSNFVVFNSMTTYRGCTVWKKRRST